MQNVRRLRHTQHRYTTLPAQELSRFSCRRGRTRGIIFLPSDDDAFILQHCGEHPERSAKLFEDYEWLWRTRAPPQWTSDPPSENSQFLDLTLHIGRRTDVDENISEAMNLFLYVPLSAHILIKLSLTGLIYGQLRPFGCQNPTQTSFNALAPS
jgi:hypothetical protein